MLACFALAASSTAAAADRLEPGIRLILTDGTEVVLEEEHLLMNRDEVASIAVLVRDLEACRKTLGDCEHESTIAPPSRRPDGLWMVALIAGAFATGLVVGASPSGSFQIRPTGR